MTLRVRLALGTGVLAAVAIAFLAAGALVAASQTVLGAVDSELLARAETAAELDAAGRLPGTDPEQAASNAMVVALADTTGERIEVLTADGTPLLGESRAPVTDTDRDIAAGRIAGPVLRTDEVDGATIRVATVHLPATGGAVRFSRDLTEVRQGLESFRLRVILGALLGGLLVAGAAWLLAGRFVAPVVAVTDAAETLARTQDVPTRITVDRSDEVGRLATSFNALLDDLAVAREQQRRLVADASHELRTPLTSLRTKIEFLQSAPDLAGSRRQEVLDGSVDELDRLGALVAELVDLAADAGSGDEDPATVDLGALVETEAARFGRTTGRTIHVDTEPLPVPARPRAVSRALSNILRNADKFSPPDQPIEVRQRGARIEVRDHGPGIAPDDRERIFDRFYRAPDASSTEGSGIGLAIVARVAEIHGGSVWADDAEGGGAIVGFSVAPPTSSHRAPTDRKETT